MQFSFEITVGTTKFTITENAENHKEFIKKAAFFSSLPAKGPNGEEDLKLVYRTTKEGHEYYSIVSERAGKELQLGQSKDMKSLYVKDWDQLFVGNKQQNSAPQAQSQAPAPVQQAPAPTPQAPQPQAAPAPQAAPRPAPAPAPQQAASAPAPQQAAPAPTPQPTNQAPAQSQPQAQAPANNDAINSVLAKYGIQNNGQ